MFGEYDTGDPSIGSTHADTERKVKLSGENPNFPMSDRIYWALGVSAFVLAEIAYIVGARLQG